MNDRTQTIPAFATSIALDLTVEFGVPRVDCETDGSDVHLSFEVGNDWGLSVTVTEDELHATFMYEEIRRDVYVYRETWIPARHWGRVVKAAVNKAGRIGAR